MIYGSVCSGIEAATVAWHPLGWKPAFFAEIDKFPSAVLAHHYPRVNNLGDFTKITPDQHDAIDLLVGGTPCQSFSIAGLRGGLADGRGNLALEYLRLARRARPRWLVWENVPGVLSSGGGRDFGSILGGMVELGYGVAYRVLDAQYVRVDGFWRAVPQRRRRVFVVGYLGDWRRAAAVLFERASLLGDSAPGRKAGEGIAPTISARPTGGGGLGTDFDCDGGLVAGTLTNSGKAAGSATQQDAEAGLLVAFGGNRQAGPLEVSTALRAHGRAHIDFESETFVAHALRAEGFDASEDGTGRGTPIVPVVAGTLKACGGKSGQPNGAEEIDRLIPVVFDAAQITSRENRSNPMPGDPCHTLAKASAGQATIAIQERAVCENPDAGPDGIGIRADGAAFTLEARTVPQAVATAWAVRRLTPKECERLQGFPDGYTHIPWRNKNWTPDGPRYKALGNSMACNVMRWVGQRIQMVDDLTKDIGDAKVA